MTISIPKTCRALLACTALACGGGDSQAPASSPPLAITKTPTGSGDSQQGLPSSTLSQPLRVLVTRGGAPEANVAVTWSTGSGGATIVGANPAMTDAGGIATASFKLGPTLGPQSAAAAISGGASTTFGAVAALPPPPQARISLSNNFFRSDRNGTSPAIDTMVAGTQVTWTWVLTNSAIHNLRSLGPQTFAPSPGGPISGEGHTEVRILNVPGIYNYECNIHAGMLHS